MVFVKKLREWFTQAANIQVLAVDDNWSWESTAYWRGAQSQRRRQWTVKYSHFPTCVHPQRFDYHLSHCSVHRKSLTSGLKRVLKPHHSDCRPHLPVDLNERATAFTTGRACTHSDIKGGYCLVPGTTPIRSADAADASRARWLAKHVVARCPINGSGCRRTWLIDSQKQPMSAADSGVSCTTPFVQRFMLLFANGRTFSDGPWKITVGMRSVLNRGLGGGRFYWISPI